MLKKQYVILYYLINLTKNRKGQIIYNNNKSFCDFRSYTSYWIE